MLVLTYIIRLYALYIDSIITTVFVNILACIPSMSRETESKLVCKCSTFIRNEKVKPAPVLWHYTSWRQLANRNFIFISYYVLSCGTYHGEHPSVLRLTIKTINAGQHSVQRSLTRSKVNVTRWQFKFNNCSWDNSSVYLLLKFNTMYIFA